MRLFNLRDVDRFFKIVDECEGRVDLITSYGDVFNLKSELTKYYSVVSLLTNEAAVKEIEIKTYSAEDAHRFVQFAKEMK